MSRDIRRLLAVTRRLDTPTQSVTLAMALNTRCRKEEKEKKKEKNKRKKEEKEESWTRRSEENRGSVGEVAGGGIRGRLRKGGGNEEADLEEQEEGDEE